MDARMLAVLLIGACHGSHRDRVVDSDVVHSDVVLDSDVADSDRADSDRGDSDVADPRACAALVGHTFSSVEQHECGLGPDGVVLCTWTIAFTADQWTWRHSDVGESGTYTCSGGAITATSGGGHPVEGAITYPDQLVWDGLAYERPPG